jgi:AcrR family transcriptional regulator
MLNVRSATDDLTTRARIRNAAIELFGRSGFGAVSVRSIADAAGVSPGLVIHHFGSKDGLRAECDRFVVGEFFGHKAALSGTGAASAMQTWLDDVETFRPLIDYLSRMLAESNPAADELFDRLLAGTALMLEEQIGAGVIREPLDREVTAIYLTIYGVVPLVLQRQLARALGGHELTAEMIRRSTLPVLDLYTNGLYADDRLLKAAKEALDRTAGPSSDKGENDPNQDPDPPGRGHS